MDTSAKNPKVAFTLVLTVLFVLVILSPVSAKQEPLPEGMAPEAESTASSVAPGGQTPDSGPNGKDPIPPDVTPTAAATASTSGGDIMKLENPTVLPETFMLTGAATYKVPIEVPPGRLGMAPNIELLYNSYQKNGWLGVGWTLDMGSIQRSTKYGLDYTKEDFVFSKNGSTTELVKTGTNEYRAKIDDGSFQKFVFNGTSWTVHDKSGKVYYYGQGASSRQDSTDPVTGQLRVFKWALDKVQDSNGNFIQISYEKNQGEIYLLRIDYTGNAGIAPTNSVSFIPEPRLDVIVTYHTHAEVKTANRLKTILIKVNETTVRTYELEYDADHATQENEYSSSTGRSLLGRIKKYGVDNTPSARDTVFSWSQGDPQYDGQDIAYVYRLRGYGTHGKPRMADVNGDGRTDIVYEDGNSYFHVLLSTGDDFTDDTQNGWVRRLKSYNSNNPGFRLADANGDGMADIIYEDGNNYIHVLLSTGNDFTEDTQFGWGRRKVGYGNYTGSGVGDFNGDGKADIIYKDKNHRTHVLFSTGSGFTQDTDTGCYPSYGTYNPQYSTLIDVDNDGKTDILYHDTSKLISSTEKRSISVYLSDGTTDQCFKAISYGYGSGYRENDIHDRWQRLLLGDVNGDGLPDIVYEDKHNNIRALINTGSGFTADDNSAIWGIRNSNYNNNSGGPQLIDMNNDGLADFVYENDKTTYVKFSLGYRDSATGIGFQDEVPWGTRTQGYKDNNSGLRIADFTGDGLVDIVYEDSQSWLRGLKSQSPYPDLIDTINNDIGGTYAVTYEPSSSYQNVLMPFIVQTVSSIEIHDGLGGISTTYYDYGDGYYDYLDREFRGFGYVLQANPDNTTLETWFHQRDTGPWYWDGAGWVNWPNCYGSIADDMDYKGRPCHSIMSAPWPNETTPGSLLSETDYTWSSDKPQGIYPMFAKLLNKSVTEYPGGVAVQRKEVNTYDDSNGNLLKTVVSSVTDPDPETVTADNLYANYGAWLWRITSQTVSGSTGQVRKTLFTYQNNTGNLLTITKVLSGVSGPTETMTYTPEGNPATKRDPNLNTTTYTYDSTKTYPTRIDYPATNGVTHFETATYDYRFGKPATKTDENSRTTTYGYDPFGRIRQVDSPDGGQVISQYYDNVFPQYVLTKAKENAAGQTIDKYDFIDGLGRKIQTITTGEAGKSIVSKTFYDNMGRAYFSEGPFFGIGFGFSQTTPADSPWTETTFNYFGKPISIQSADGQHGTVTSSIAYSGLSTTVTDPDGNSKKETKDYLGRVKQVVEYADAGQQTTNYAYNAAGDLLTVTDHLGNTTSMTYDTLGRKINMTDPDMGYWLYTYDANGNLKTQTDAKAQISTFNYDALNRVTSKTYSPVSGDNPPVVYTYDSLAIPNGKGRLYSVTNTKATTVYNGYDSMGRALSSTKTIQGDPALYTTATAYDYSGKPTVITYPYDGYQVTNSYYPGSGLLYSVTGPGVVYASLSNYTPSGKIGQIVHQNNTATAYSYDPKSTRLTGIVTTSPSSTGLPKDDVINRAYNYSPAGDILSITDYKKGNELGLPGDIFNYAYQYDRLHRFTNEATTNGVYNPVAYTYNAIGNILSKVSGPTTLGYTYHPTKKHAVSSITVNGTPYSFVYDNNGNMTSGFDLTNPASIVPRSITWNADNMPTVVTRNGISTTIAYDGGSARVKKVSPSVTTYYIGEHFEVINGDPTKYVFAGNLRVAKVGAASGTYYFHKDHLGSSSSMTTDAGTVVETTNYRPYGEQREHTGLTLSNYKFTDQELDPETGLYNYGARLYDAVTGRFISPDSMVPDPFDQQSLNRYSYVVNNPLIYVDPTGNIYEISLYNSGSSGWTSYYSGGYYTSSYTGGGGSWSVSISIGSGSFGSGPVIFGGGGSWSQNYSSSASWGNYTGSQFNNWGNNVTQNTGWFSGLQNYLDESAYQRFLEGRDAAAGVNILASAMIDVFLPQVPSDLPLMMFGNIGKIGKYGMKGVNVAKREVEFIVKARKALGVDGGRSIHIIEEIGGRTNSVTQQVTRNGEIIHQHQKFVGRYGNSRIFPDEWSQYPYIDIK